MDILLITTILSLIALFSSLLYSIYKKKYDIAIGIAIMAVVLIVMRYVAR